MRGHGAIWSDLGRATAIAGICGSNFEHMPELARRFGCPLLVGMIAASSLVLYVRFKRVVWI